MRRQVLAFALMACAISPVFAQTKAKGPNADIDNIGTRDINKKTPNFTSIEDEIAVGKALAADIESRITLLADPDVNAYVGRIGQLVVRNSDSKIPVVFKVVDSADVNAFSLPGGWVYINAGMIRGLENEAELAAALAHQVAHVAARHAIESEAKTTILNTTSVPMVIFGGPVGMILRQASSTIVPLQVVGFAQKNVTEADFLGVQYLYKAGYDPRAFITMLQKLQAVEQKTGGTMSTMFATHPPIADRIKETEKNIQRILPVRSQNALNSPEFDQVKAKLGN